MSNVQNILLVNLGYCPGDRKELQVFVSTEPYCCLLKTSRLKLFSLMKSISGSSVTSGSQVGRVSVMEKSPLGSHLPLMCFVWSFLSSAPVRRPAPLYSTWVFGILWICFTWFTIYGTKLYLCCLIRNQNLLKKQNFGDDVSFLKGYSKYTEVERETYEYLNTHHESSCVTNILPILF